MCRVQHNQMVAFKEVTRNLGRLTESLARLDINEMKWEMVGAMRDMMREESVTQLCAQRPGPSAREPPPEYPASEVRREESAPPARGKQALLGQKLEAMPECGLRLYARRRHQWVYSAREISAQIPMCHVWHRDSLPRPTAM